MEGWKNGTAECSRWGFASRAALGTPTREEGSPIPRRALWRASAFGVRRLDAAFFRPRRGCAEAIEDDDEDEIEDEGRRGASPRIRGHPHERFPA